MPSLIPDFRDGNNIEQTIEGLAEASRGLSEPERQKAFDLALKHGGQARQDTNVIHRGDRTPHRSGTPKVLTEVTTSKKANDCSDGAKITVYGAF